MSDWLPLTAAQRGLFFAHELAPDNPCYTTAEVVELAGPVDADLLRRAHLLAYGEHEQLRVEVGLGPEGPRQRVLPRDRFASGLLVDVEVADAAAGRAWIAAELARPFVLTGRAAGPLLRSALLRLPDGRSWWLHAAHHLLLDGYGAQQLLRRVAAHHDALRAGHAAADEPRTALAAVVAEDLERASAMPAAWIERLASYDGVVGLAGRAAPAAPSAVRVAVDLDEPTQAAVVAGARALRVGWSDLLVAAVGSWLARMTGRGTTRVGLPLMNRTMPGVGQLASARTVCTAMNVLPHTVPATGTVATCVTAAAAEQRAAREHPFTRQELLQQDLERRAPGAQLFGAQLNLIPFDLEITLGGVAGTVRNATAGPVEDMTIGVRGTPGRGRAVRLELDANPRLYAADEIEAHLDRLRSWIRAFAEAARDAHDTDVADLPLVGVDELALIDSFNDTARFWEARTLGHRFVAQASATPDAVALVHGTERRTYAELLDRARRIAGGLAARGVRAGDVVGIAQPRSLGLYETIHALALLGAVYLPLDPDLPDARLDAMQEDASARVVVSDPEEFAGGEPVALDAVPDDVDAPAYLLFTSGSTGRPKGVVVGHRAIDNRLRWMQRHVGLQPGERVLHKTPISFDVSVWELYWPLQVGGCVVIADPGDHRDPRRIAELVVEGDVRVLHFVPSMLRAFLADRRSRERVGTGRVRTVVCSGEALTPDLVEGCHDAFGVAPTNLYGPTEAAVDVTAWDCSLADEGAVPIGRPIDNTTCHVLDDAQRPLPIGVVGELWLGGVQLAHGYVGRPDLTAERFVDVVLPGGVQRLYRTGDLGAWRRDGALRYLGRTDDQVKIRGQRVELGEIEAAVAGEPIVDAVAAGVVDEQLVLWFVRSAAAGAPDDAAAVLRQRAGVVLPEGWVPHHFVEVPVIPLGTSGKADRKALAASHRPLEAVAATGRAPASLVEQRLGDLFGAAIGRGPLTPDADFFAAGGDSLAVLRLIAAIESDLGIDVRLGDVFAAPTPAALAAAVAADRPGDAGTGELLTLRAAPGSNRPPLFLLPPAGGLGWCYTGLLAGLPIDQPVHVLQAPGLSVGVPVEFDDLVELATHQLGLIRGLAGGGAFHVAGWSLGGMAAHTVAALARDDGQQVGAVVLLDAYPSDQWQQLAEPTEQEALVGIARMGGVEGLLHHDVDRAAVAAALRAGGSALAELPIDVLDGCLAGVVSAARLVRTSRHLVLTGDVDVVVATAPRVETWLDATGWSSYTKGAVRQHPVDVTHGDLVRRPASDAVAALLTALLTT